MISLITYSFTALRTALEQTTKEYARTSTIPDDTRTRVTRGYLQMVRADAAARSSVHGAKGNEASHRLHSVDHDPRPADMFGRPLSSSFYTIFCSLSKENM